MLDRAAYILSLRGENSYRVRAYKRAARSVASSPMDMETLVRENRLQVLDGVGSALAGKIKEIIKTGNLSLLERMESGTIPEADPHRMVLLAAARTLSTEVLPEMAEMPGVINVAVTGALRRCRETMTSLELVLAVDDMPRVKKSLESYGRLRQLQWEGNLCRATHVFGIRLVLYMVSLDDFIQTLWITTGTPGHVKKVAARVLQHTDFDLLHQEPGARKYTLEDEPAIYQWAGLPFIHPELREGLGEVEEALQGALPQLVQASDYRGDLHVHSDWSDGTASLENMVESAAELGYSYIAFTDHSRSLKIAGGLTLEKLEQQCEAIRRLREKYPGLAILSGIEVDILGEGSLDAPDKILSGLDVVIASIHSGFRQGREKMTRRICRAMQNPHVQIVAHATGRLLGKREAYDVDMGEVIRIAAETGTALEINSSPDRLDINDQLARQAKQAGVMVAVNTDAHSRLELANVVLGLSVARRGWLSAEDVLNTRETKELLRLLHEKRKKSPVG
jgi:DNA polymerase (family 10)